MPQPTENRERAEPEAAETAGATEPIAPTGANRVTETVETSGEGAAVVHNDGDVTVNAKDTDYGQEYTFNKYRKTKGGEVKRISLGGATATSDDFILDTDSSSFDEALSATDKPIRCKVHGSD